MILARILLKVDQREDETAAAAVGIDPHRIRVISSVPGSGIGAVAGVLQAHLIGIIEPEDLDILRSMTFLIFVAFGGLEICWGALLGTADEYSAP